MQSLDRVSQSNMASGVAAITDQKDHLSSITGGGLLCEPLCSNYYRFVKPGRADSGGTYLRREFLGISFILYVEEDLIAVVDQSAYIRPGRDHIFQEFFCDIRLLIPAAGPLVM